MTALDDTAWRGKVLGAVVGNSAWFSKLQSRLPTLMLEPDPITQGKISILLRAALQFDRKGTVGLISSYWSTEEHDKFVADTFHNFSDWDEQTIRMMESVLSRQDLQSYLPIHMAESALGMGFGFSSRLIVSALTHAIRA